MTRQRLLTAGIWVFLALFPLLADAIGQGYWINIWTRILILGLVAMSLNLIMGYGGMVSLGHAAYFGVGGYAVALIAFHVTQKVPLFGWAGSNEALVVWPIAMVISGLLALVLGALCLRTRGVYFIMLTLAFSQMLFFIVVALKYYGGDDGLAMTGRNTLAGMSLAKPMALYYVTFVVLLLAWVLLARITQSPFGRALQAGKINERRAQALGIPVRRVQLIAFVIAGVLAGLGGALWANQMRIASPDMLHWMRSGELIMMVILGGLGSHMGAIVGAAALVLLEAWLAGLTEHWMLILGAILVLTVLFVRKGLFLRLAGSGHER
jgi:branched-chain amino acid transport system permease protein